jgi:hypothetical protein
MGAGAAVTTLVRTPLSALLDQGELGDLRALPKHDGEGVGVLVALDPHPLAPLILGDPTAPIGSPSNTLP